MYKPLVSRPKLFVFTNGFDHPITHSRKDTNAVLDYSKIEPDLSSIYAITTDHKSHQLLAFFPSFLEEVWCRLSDFKLS